MDKKEYISARLRRDLLDLCLLQPGKMTSAQIARSMLSYLDEVLSNLELKFKAGKKEILSSTLHSEVSQTLAPGEDLSLYEKVGAKIENLLATQDISSLPGEALTQVLTRIENLCWKEGLRNVSDAVTLFVSTVGDMAQSYEEKVDHTDYMPSLQEKLEEAEEVSLSERIRSNNDEDVLKFRFALRTACSVLADNLYNSFLARSLKEIASSNLLLVAKDNIEKGREYALKLRFSIPDLDDDPDLEKEYARIVPTDFFRRNVKAVDQYDAFMMVIQQAIARNEDRFISLGFLSGGELYLFTNPEFCLSDKTMDLLVGMIS